MELFVMLEEPMHTQPPTHPHTHTHPHTYTKSQSTLSKSSDTVQIITVQLLSNSCEYNALVHSQEQLSLVAAATHSQSGRSRRGGPAQPADKPGIISVVAGEGVWLSPELLCMTPPPPVPAAAVREPQHKPAGVVCVCVCVWGGGGGGGGISK